MQIAHDRVVSFHYTLKNDAGEVLDRSAPGQPLSYQHGHANIVPGLEKALAGLTEGDTFEVAVPPAEGYGVKRSDSTQRLPRDAFGDTVPQVGAQYATRTPEGSVIPLWVEAVGPGGITITFDHPLAGETLHCSGRIESVRMASAKDAEPSCGCC